MAESLNKEFLRKQLECPVCLETLKPPVKQCINGHITCSSCVKRLTKCPLCTLPLLENNPTFVNNLLAALPQPCKNSHQGCKELCEGNDDHEIYCGFRSVICRICDKMLQVDKLVDHMKTHHKNCLLHGPRRAFVCPDFNPNQSRWWDAPVVLGGTMFYIYLHKKPSEQSWNIFFQANWTKKPAKEQFLRIELKSEDGIFSASSTLTPIINKDESGCSLKDIIDEVVKNNEHLCMRVSLNLMQRLVEKDRLSVSYTFFQH